MAENMGLALSTVYSTVLVFGAMPQSSGSLQVSWGRRRAGKLAFVCADFNSEDKLGHKWPGVGRPRCAA